MVATGKEKSRKKAWQGRETQFLRLLLDEGISNERRRKMIEGEKYFACQHDVLERDLRRRQVTQTKRLDDGSETEEMECFYNPNRSNYRCAHPFHKILVTQKAAYLVGREPTLLVKGNSPTAKQFTAELEQFADSHFNEVLYNWIIGASNKGVEYVHIYYDKDGNLNYCIVPAEDAIVLYDEESAQEEMTDFIRILHCDVWENGRKYCRKKVEWWTAYDVTYYTETQDGTFCKQKDSPHWNMSWRIDGCEVENQAHGWGRVPFIPLKNNGRESTDLEQIKGLIDAYDMVSSEGTNQLLDLVDLYWVIQGYGGETASAIARKLQINKAVHISDSDGGVEAKQVELPMDGRISWLKMLRKDIFHFGMGVDTDSEDWSKAPSGVALKMQYGMFRLKVGSMIPYIKDAICQLCAFVAEDLDRKDGGRRREEKIQVILNESMMTDDMEIMEILTLSKDMLSEETILSKHPFVTDVNSEMRALAQQKTRKEEMEDESGTQAVQQHTKTGNTER